MFSLLDAVQIVLGTAAVEPVPARPGVTLARVSGFEECKNGIRGVSRLRVGVAVAPSIDARATVGGAR